MPWTEPFRFCLFNGRDNAVRVDNRFDSGPASGWIGHWDTGRPRAELDEFFLLSGVYVVYRSANTGTSIEAERLRAGFKRNTRMRAYAVP